jgi:hypothetical protein
MDAPLTGGMTLYVNRGDRLFFGANKPFDVAQQHYVQFDANIRYIKPTATLARLELRPSSVQGGQITEATITLSAPAPAEGIVIALSSNNALVGVPPTVSFVAGETSNNVTVTTSPVNTTAQSVITARYGSTEATANLDLQPAVPTISLDLNCDGVVSIADVMKFLQYVILQEPLCSQADPK